MRRRIHTSTYTSNDDENNQQMYIPMEIEYLNVLGDIVTINYKSRNIQEIHFTDKEDALELFTDLRKQIVEERR